MVCKLKECDIMAKITGKVRLDLFKGKSWMDMDLKKVGGNPKRKVKKVC